MQTKITIRNEAQTCYIDIEGTIGRSEEHQKGNGSSSVATFEAFRREVARIAEVAATSVVVNIRSTGGDVNDALLIYEALQGLDARITTRCYGYTASAATIIAQAADKGCRELSSNTMYLIHKSTCAIDGNADSLDSRAELLRKTDERLAQLYALHGQDTAENYALLMAENNGEGRWLTAQEAVDAGLADKIIDSLMVGVEIPEPESEDTDSTEPKETASEEPLVEARGKKTITKEQARSAIGRAAHAVIRYLLGRVAYRWDAWMDRLEKQREEKLEERIDERKARKQKKSKEQPKDNPTEVSTPATTSEENTTLPQDRGAITRSSILFEEGQLKARPTMVKSVEDPSMARQRSLSNEKAYDEDAKLFTRA
ncbi:MAG: Clp protease ClpP [Alistipes sp.]|nr:Clp protease ClpP [Alistipes sp.]